MRKGAKFAKGKRKRSSTNLDSPVTPPAKKQLSSGADQDDFGDIDMGAEDTVADEEGPLDQETTAPAKASRKKQKKQRVQKQQGTQTAQADGGKQVLGRGMEAAACLTKLLG